MKNKVIVIGAGFSGLATAAYLCKKGFEVDIYEKHEIPGGRARTFSADNFHFDMGPTFISFPEITEHLLGEMLGTNNKWVAADKIDPSYRIYINDSDILDISPNLDQTEELFDSRVKGGGVKLNTYLKTASREYEVWKKKIENNELVTTGSNRLSELFHKTHSSNIRSLFNDSALLTCLEFPVSSMGVFPIQDSSCSYLHNYSLLAEGLHAPQGGISHLINEMVKSLEAQGINLHLSSPVESLDTIGDHVSGIITHGKNFHADYFVAATDYQHAEHLLPRESRNYTDSSWQHKSSAPTALIVYIGVKKKLEKLAPNGVFFNTPAPKNRRLSSDKKFLQDIPAIFFSCPSKVYPSYSETGETLIIRVILPEGIEDIGIVREHYFEKAIHTIEKITGESILDYIAYKKTFAQTDFQTDYHTFRGHAFGNLSNNYFQGKMSYKIQNKHFKNLFYAEHPVFLGSGITSALLTGKHIASELQNYHNKQFS